MHIQFNSITDINFYYFQCHDYDYLHSFSSFYYNFFHDTSLFTHVILTPQLMSSLVMPLSKEHSIKYALRVALSLQPAYFFFNSRCC
jgi:hypothetical protein